VLNRRHESKTMVHSESGCRTSDEAREEREDPTDGRACQSER
jgi:hypothetical protein